ncbi:MAG: AAA family ATPase [Thiofilum sp.]|uniref:bifunctional aminoglycoside phosphotransferase/ATP-binding protein n=1 Tax=Thiofilum sp. TaxID=2212733 RepID=UPI0025D229E1|nr:bifunctional aminoglycoside phosphotransferase/ATP-binding protein [Thiofilum sp.]MBK8454063.1 AAA family ATPase [Thiofilum sp.]
MDNPNTLESLLAAMQNSIFYPHAVSEIQLIETHISYIILTGDYAYKLKKPVRFDFLDYSTLALRQHHTELELTLNRRLAPQIYLTVLAVIKTSAQQFILKSTTELSEHDTVVEYVLKMRQFASNQEFDHLLEQGKLPLDLMPKLAQQIAQFHQQAERAASNTLFGTPPAIYDLMHENFTTLAHIPLPAAHRATLNTLEQWTQVQYQALSPLLEQRKQQGFIRACHGDLHLGNIALIEGQPTAFDGIEFNEQLRWIDTLCDLAFLMMDLEARHAPTHARRVLNEYLSATGDYSALALLNFYKIYRALVRAKVQGLQIQQHTDEQQGASYQEHCIDYINLAKHYTQTTSPQLFITHGLSGSGKSWGCRTLVDEYGVIQVRSDVERKRLVGLHATERASTGLQQGIYAPAMSQKTYHYLLELSELILTAGYSVVVDAAFLERSHRDPFAQLAQRLNLPFTILHFSATPQQLAQNIRTRLANNQDASDADLSVLQQQLAHYQPLEADEPIISIAFGTKIVLTH